MEGVPGDGRPLEFIPAKREVWLYESLDISLELGPSTEAEQEILARSYELQEEWVAELAQAVVNPEEIGPQAPGVLGPVPISRRWVLILPGYPEREGRDRWIDTFEPLRAHRQNQGLDTEVIYVKQITEASGEAAVQDIRAYLQDQHANHGARWACLVGDHEMIPWTYLNPKTLWPWQDYGWQIPHDWCYCDLDGAWPNGHDWYPELWVGRVPCLTTAEGANFVGKVLAYEQNPGNGDHGYLSRSLYEYADEPQAHQSCDSLEVLDDPMIQSTRWGEIPSYLDPAPYSPTAASIVSEISNVGFNCVVVHCHGDTDLFRSMTQGCGLDSIAVSNFRAAHVESLTNENYYFYWYSISCFNAQLDDNSGIRSIAEAATCMFPARGAIAFAGNTRAGKVNHSYSLNYWAWAALYPNGPLLPRYFNHAGAVQATSRLRAFEAGLENAFDDYVRYSHNLFGDPATGVWTPKCMPPAVKPMSTVALTTGASVPILRCEPVLAHDSCNLVVSTPSRTQATLILYNVAGRAVRSLGTRECMTGTERMRIDISGLPTGVYVASLRTMGPSATATLVVIR